MIHTRVGDDPIRISDSYRFPLVHEPMRVGSMSGLDAWQHAVWAVQSILQDVADWNAFTRAAVFGIQKQTVEVSLARPQWSGERSKNELEVDAMKQMFEHNLRS